MSRDGDDYDPIRDISFAPSTKKFVTCSENKMIQVWDFLTS